GQCERIPEFLVFAALHQPVTVLGINLALSVFRGVIYQHNDFTRQRYRIIRLSSDTHRECLGLRNCVQLAFSIFVDWNLAQVGGGTIWRDDPKYVGQEFRSQCRGLWHSFYLHFNVRTTFLGIYLGLTTCIWCGRASDENHLSCPFANFIAN